MFNQPEDGLLARANALVKAMADQKAVMAEMKRIYLMDWGEGMSEKAPYIREMRDTQPFDAVNWAVDVLSANPPHIEIEIPRVLIDTKGASSSLQTFQELPHDTGEVIEAAVRKALAQNDSTALNSLLRNVVTSMFLYDMAVVKVADIRNTARWKKSRLRDKHRSPFVIKAYDPTNIYYETDEYGVSAVLQRYIRPLHEVIAIYGSQEDIDADSNGNVIFCEWWERDKMAKWVERTVNYNETIDSSQYVSAAKMLEPYTDNPLGFIPYAIRIGRGVQFFQEHANQIMPLLYGGWKSKLFYRANLFLSIVSTLAFAMANPQFVYASHTGEKTFDLDFSAPAVHAIQVGESISPMNVGLNRDLYDVLQLVLGKSEQTTMPRVLAGQAPGGVTAASAINLLIQGGKLNVNPVQSAVGELYTSVIDIILDYIKVNKEPIRFLRNDSVQEIGADNIPEWLDVKVSLQTNMPQDKAMLYNIAMQAWKAGFISKSTAWDIAGVDDKQREAALLDIEKAMQVQEDMENQQPQAVPSTAGAAGQMLPQQQQMQNQVEMNPQANNPLLDLMNAQENANANPMERFE